eukprot:scaffold2529_cov363-Prasinococcus_capsulatus_cf.AAC.19
MARFGQSPSPLAQVAKIRPRGSCPPAVGAQPTEGARAECRRRRWPRCLGGAGRLGGGRRRGYAIGQGWMEEGHGPPTRRRSPTLRTQVRPIEHAPGTEGSLRATQRPSRHRGGAVRIHPPSMQTKCYIKDLVCRTGAGACPGAPSREVIVQLGDDACCMNIASSCWTSSPSLLATMVSTHKLLLLAASLASWLGRSISASCGYGESLAFWSWEECCSVGPVSSYSYTVDGGSNNDNMRITVRNKDAGTYYPSSECDIYNNGDRCVGDGCVSSYRNDCQADGNVNDVRLCVYFDCENWVAQCNVKEFHVEFTSAVTYSWSTGSWGSCSTSCGGGYQTRLVQCRSSTDSLVIDSKCSGTKPSTSRTCNTQACTTYSWSTGSWGSCSASCGGGYQTRSVQCRSSTDSVVSDGNCSGSKPSTSRTCNTQACSTYYWSTGSWGSCSASCGGGYQTRSVQCRSSTGSAVGDSICSGSKPSISQACNTQACSVGSSSQTQQSCECYCCRGNFCSRELVGSLDASSSSTCTDSRCRDQYNSQCPQAGQSGSVSVSFVGSSSSNTPSPFDGAPASSGAGRIDKLLTSAAITGCALLMAGAGLV